MGNCVWGVWKLWRGVWNNSTLPCLLYTSRANAIAPGFILTDMTAALSDEVRAEWAKKIPLRRGGTPEDVANIATFLASDMSSYVSGQVIQVCLLYTSRCV